MYRKHIRRNTTRGFSLIEVVIALSVMTMIGTIALMTITSTLDVRNTLKEQDELYRSMRVGMDRIKKELRVAFLTNQTAAIGTYQTDSDGQNRSTTPIMCLKSSSIMALLPPMSNPSSEVAC
mgnify:CR=1 FL=1